MNPAVLGALYTAQQLIEAIALVQSGRLSMEEFNERVAALGVDIQAAEDAWKRATGDSDAPGEPQPDPPRGGGP